MVDSEGKPQVELKYDTLWKAIIRPPRETYDDETLGEPSFTYHKVNYVRHDYEILNTRGKILKCSFLESVLESRTNYIMPVVIYLHGNASCRMEGIKYSPELLKRGINIFVFDFEGCGQSEGDYISLGWYEKDDVRTVIDFLEKLPGVGNIGLWGRSMGAATTMLYAYSDKRVKAICMDSPFAEFKVLAKELVNQYVKLPDFIIEGTMSLIKNTVKEKNNLDIDKLQPLIYANKTKVPAFFVHAMNDELINLDQTTRLYEAYAGKKTLNVVEGGHNSSRQKHINEKIAKFFAKYLGNDIEGDELEEMYTSNFNNVNDNISPQKEIASTGNLTDDMVVDSARNLIKIPKHQ